MASVFLFVNFRVTGSTRFREWSKGIWKRVPKQAPSPPTPTPTHPMKSPPVSGYLETKQVQKGGLKSTKILTDVLISLGVGISGTLFLLEAKCGKDLRNDYETAPLVAGRSFLVDKMCPGMLELHRSDPIVRNVLSGHATHKDKHESHDEETTTRNNNNTNTRGSGSDDPGLATFAIFIENCQKRANHEARLRKERNGIRWGNDPVLIPHTGVR